MDYHLRHETDSKEISRFHTKSATDMANYIAIRINTPSSWLVDFGAETKSAEEFKNLVKKNYIND